jgi:hypothetical protein
MRDKVPDFAGNLKSFKKSVDDAKRLGQAFESSLKASGRRTRSKAKPRKKKCDI